MSTLAFTPAIAGAPPGPAESLTLRLEDLGELDPVGRPGGQGRVYRPRRQPAALTADPVVVKLYRRAPTTGAADLLAQMIAWSRRLDADQQARLHRVTAWPLATITRGGVPAGIAMHDVSGRFEVPIVMPSGRQDRVLLSLEHLLGADDYLQLRGLGVRLDTMTRARVAEQVAGALAFLHRHGIVASDIAPNNLLIRLSGGEPGVGFIDCDSMVFHGRQALPQVETADWQIPPEFSEPPHTRAADAYKLGLVILRLFARSHDARTLAPHVRYVPAELRDLIARSLAPDPANRPPAGEWQRALRQAVLRGGLSARYPGPVPVRAVPRPRPAAPPRHWDTPPPAVKHPPRPAPRRNSSHQPLSLLRFALVALIFMLILARLLAGLSPSFSGSGFAPGGAAGSTGQPSPPYEYYTPYGSGSGDGFR